MSTDHEHDALISQRKSAHLELCLDEARYAVESGKTRLQEVHLIHRALPEIDAATVDTSIDFLGMRVSLPLFISSMTGGSAEGYRINKDLAVVARELGIPVGMGSIRILLRKREVIDDFRLKTYASTVPVFANIGGVQLPQIDHEEVFSLIEELGVDAIAVHLNPAQELFQEEGDRDFSGVLEAIARFTARAPVPVIAKETGFGINPAEVDRLFEAGVAWVDIAGSGGTNWARVEAYRHSNAYALPSVAGFDEWGLPTALVLAALGRDRNSIIASGGLRSGIDVVKSLALGATTCGMALPFVRALKSGGIGEAVDFGRSLEYVIRNAMVLSGCRTVRELRRAPLWLDRGLRDDAQALSRACKDEYDGGR